jgi:leucyl-tRNA synthetase
VVSPDKLIEEYGADTVRLYTLFIGPPEKDADWSDRGVEGAFRFLNRVWRLVDRVSGLAGERVNELAGQPANPQTGELQNLRRKTHQTIKKVTSDIENGFYFNTAIASIMELVNETYQNLAAPQAKEAVETIVLLLAPFAPHICEELWQRLGHKPGIFKNPWPQHNPEFIQTDVVTIVVQVNGKVRSKLDVPASTTEEELKKAVLADEKTKTWIGTKPVRKIIVVPKKLINIVV